MYIRRGAARGRRDQQAMEGKPDEHRGGVEDEKGARTAAPAREKERGANTYRLNSRGSLLRDNAQLATLLASMSDLIDRARAIKSLPKEEEAHALAAADPAVQPTDSAL